MSTLRACVPLEKTTYIKCYLVPPKLMLCLIQHHCTIAFNLFLSFMAFLHLICFISHITNAVGEPSFADGGCKPNFGMEFDSEETAYKFYNEYAGKMGFSIRMEAVVKNKHTGEVTSRIFVCSNEGFRSKDKRYSLTKHPRVETRTGCDAQMSIKLNRKSGGRESLGYIKQDIKNYLQSKRQKQLAFGEAGSLLKYFHKQILENPSFFHVKQLDNEEQITNILWDDAKMILDYGQFGDMRLEKMKRETARLKTNVGS
ncbi:hypothetical protein Dsin_000339 [Dipteronia sinensis]|uniref:FAR1 domain-containing protein n=1 Tax=Dipteronia sinensis TaxID=43782 RepID=A0AAE0EHB7_9ROSI|nr:hypothetical protein Dsin_000339 [Dipteronia sinensis]